MQRLKVNDNVVVIAGKDKGRTGTITKFLPGRERAIIENINMAKRHTKANPAKNEPGGIVEREMPIHISNLMHYNPANSKGERVGIKILEDGRKVRYFRSNNEVIDI